MYENERFFEDRPLAKLRLLFLKLIFISILSQDGRKFYGELRANDPIIVRLSTVLIWSLVRIFLFSITSKHSELAIWN